MGDHVSLNLPVFILRGFPHALVRNFQVLGFASLPPDNSLRVCRHSFEEAKPVVRLGGKLQFFNFPIDRKIA